MSQDLSMSLQKLKGLKVCVDMHIYKTDNNGILLSPNLQSSPFFVWIKITIILNGDLFHSIFFLGCMRRALAPSTYIQSHILKLVQKVSIVVCTFKPSTWKAETHRSLWIWVLSQPGIYTNILPQLTNK